MTNSIKRTCLFTAVAAIAALTFITLPASARDETCIAECKQRHRDKIEICDDLVNSSGSVYYRNTVWHRQCLQEARTEFDNCLSTCQ